MKLYQNFDTTPLKFNRSIVQPCHKLSAKVLKIFELRKFFQKKMFFIDINIFNIYIEV